MSFNILVSTPMTPVLHLHLHDDAKGHRHERVAPAA